MHVGCVELFCPFLLCYFVVLESGPLEGVVSPFFLCKQTPQYNFSSKYFQSIFYLLLSCAPLISTAVGFEIHSTT